MAIVQIPYLSLYSTSCIKLINHLVWGIYRDLSIQDGKNLSVSCRNSMLSIFYKFVIAKNWQSTFVNLASWNLSIIFESPNLPKLSKLPKHCSFDIGRSTLSPIPIYNIRITFP